MNQSDAFSAPEEFERQHVRPRAGRTLIVGSYVTKGKVDRRMLFPDAVGVDARPGPGVDVVADMELPQPSLGLFEHVECCSVLEHTRRPWLLAANLERLMVAGATLHFSVPFIWREHQHPADYWRMTAQAVREIFPGIAWLALLYGNRKLYETGKVPALKGQDGLPYLGRTEVLGFGVRG